MHAAPTVEVERKKTSPDSILDYMGNRRRREIIRQLEFADRNVADLVRSVGLRQQAISHHLTILKLRGLVRFSRQGKCNFYTLTDLGRKALQLLEFAGS